MRSNYRLHWHQFQCRLGSGHRPMPNPRSLCHLPRLRVTTRRCLPYAAFTPAQHVARQQVARTSNLLRATNNMLRATSCFKQHVARNKRCRATCCAGVNAVLQSETNSYHAQTVHASLHWKWWCWWWTIFSFLHVLHFHVLQNHALRFGQSFSCLAFSGPAFSAQPMKPPKFIAWDLRIWNSSKFC